MQNQHDFETTTEARRAEDHETAIAKARATCEAFYSPIHEHEYRRVPKGERTDRLRFVCTMYRCSCGDSYTV